MSRGAVVYLVICLPSSLLKLNLSGCRQNLLDEGQSNFKLHYLRDPEPKQWGTVDVEPCPCSASM